MLYISLVVSKKRVIPWWLMDMSGADEWSKRELRELISHKHKFIFVHVGRTGGCSIEAALGGIGARFFNPEQPDDERHRKLSDYKRLFPDIFDDYFKFAFVRNPWARMVSAYAYNQSVAAARLSAVDSEIQAARMQADARKLTKAERRRVKVLENRPYLSFREFVLRPRSNQLHEGGNDMVPYFDFVGRFETLHEDFETVCARLGVQEYAPPRQSV